MIIASCGHQVTSIKDLCSAYVADHSRDGTPCLKYQALCYKCFTQLSNLGVVLTTYPQEP